MGVVQRSLLPWQLNSPSSSSFHRVDEYYLQIPAVRTCAHATANISLFSLLVINTHFLTAVITAFNGFVQISFSYH